MQDTVKRKIELEKKQLSLKNMYFNRYLFVRYLTAFFFFMNMQWMILLLSAKSLGSSLPMILILAILPLSKAPNECSMDKAVFFVSGCLQYIIDSSVVHLRIYTLVSFYGK